MLAAAGQVTSLEEFIFDDDWLMEQKLDGHRLMLRSAGGPNATPTAITRGGAIYTRGVPNPIATVQFPAGDWLLDGELVEGTYWVFDILAAAGQDLTQVPQAMRRLWLENALQTFKHPFKIVPQAQTTEEKIKLAERSLRENFEGLVLKLSDAPYRYNARSKDWLKVKYTCTADVTVLAVRDDGKDSVKLGVFDAGGQLVEIGRASLLGKEKNGSLKVGDVCEVRYLYTGTGGRLYQPTILRVRDDKTPPECTTAQLKAVNKAVLESL
jgi:bifunctional non-homologous end joining protein LigD